MKIMKFMTSVAVLLITVSLGFSQENDGEKIVGLETKNNETTKKKSCVTPTTVCDCVQSQGEPVNGCVHVSIAMGPKSPGSMLNSGKLTLLSMIPSASMYTPQGLRYVKDYAIGELYDSRGNGAYGSIELLDPYGTSIRYDFASGSSLGIPLGGQYYSNHRLMMVDEEGWATTNNPAYYDLYVKSGDLYRFCASTNSVHYRDLIMMRSVSGRQEQYSDAGYQIIKDSSGVLRQIKTATELADLIVQSASSYRVDMYKVSQLQTGTDTNGYYVPLGGQLPYTTWVFENPGTAIKDITIRKIINLGTSSTTNTYYFVYTDSSSQWELTQEGSNVKETDSEDWSDDQSQMLETISKNSVAGGLASREQRLYHVYSWGTVMVSKMVGTGADALITSNSYYNTSSQTGRYGNVSETINPDGSWVWYDYDSMGRVIKEKRTFKDTPRGTAESAATVTYYDYTPVASGDASTFNDQRSRIVTEKVLDITVAKTFHAYVTNSVKELQEIEEQCASATSSYGDEGNLRTTKTYYGTNVTGYLVGRLKSVQQPTGLFDTYNYEYGDYQPSTNPASFTPNPDGEYWRETVTHGTTNSPDGIAGKTTREVKVLDAYSQQVLSETYLCTGGTNYERIAWTVQQFNDFYKPIATYKSDGTLAETVWASCGCTKQSETDVAGIEKVYGVDLLNRVTSSTKIGANNLTSSNTYNAAGMRITETLTGGTGSNAISMLLSSNVYNLAGQVTSSMDSLGIITSYNLQNGGQISTTIRASVTNYTENYLDGRTKCTKLNGVIRSWQDYGANSDGTSWTITYSGPDGASSPMWQKSTTDLLGRTIRTEQPGYGGVVLTNLFVYDSSNHLRSSASIGGYSSHVSLFEYNELGEQIRSGLDVNTNGVLDLASMDRITESETYYEQDASTNWWQVSISRLYAGDSSAVVTTNSIQKTQLTGLGVGGLVSLALSYDILGNQATSMTTIDRDNKTVTQATTYPDSTNDAVSVSINGLLVSSTAKTGLEYTYGYDGLERQTGVTDPRTGTSITHYNSKGQVDYVEDPATNRTIFAYEESTGRQISTTDALTNTVYTHYSVEGLVLGTWGATYPVAYEFDYWNRMTAMYTCRGTNSISSYSELEALKSSMDRTQWKYELATGLLTNKLYADNNGPRYVYTTDGKLASRIWARTTTNNQQLATVYSYTNTGDMVSIGYSDSTPGVGFTINRLGQQITITDGQGTRAFTYNDALQLASETNALALITRQYDSLGRSSGFSLTSDLGPLTSASYSFDQLGRFSSLSSVVGGLSSNSWQYSYLPNSDLVSGLSNSVVQFEKAFEQHRNLLTQVKNTSGINLISQFDYVNDELGRRTQRIDSGSSVASNSFGYNPRSELINASMGANSYAWDLDSIGNRISDTSNSVTHSYTANSLNQYTQITNGGIRNLFFDLDGNMTQSVTLSNDGATTNQYAWDGENRMIGASGSGMVANYKYDYMSRRYEKVVNGTTTNTFIWDGWLLASEICNSPSGITTNIYVWGQDLSGTLQGAGGIGGLVSVTIISNGTTSNYFPVTDANGNVTDYLDANGTVVAHREYDAYGNTVVATGALVHELHFWFSSKYLDEETGLYYYGLRYYSAILSRWLNRDPIEEEGGLLLYGFVGNNPVNWVDILGNVRITVAYEYEVSSIEMIRLSQKFFNDDVLLPAGLTHYSGDLPPVFFPEYEFQEVGSLFLVKGVTEARGELNVHFWTNAAVDKVENYAKHSPAVHEDMHVQVELRGMDVMEKDLKSHYVGKCVSSACKGEMEMFAYWAKSVAEAWQNLRHAQLDQEDWAPSDKKTEFEKGIPQLEANLSVLAKSLKEATAKMEAICGKQ